MKDETTVHGPRSSSPNTHWSLRGLLGSSAGREYPITPGTYLIGKLVSAEIRLVDSGVSRNHAELSLSSEGKATLTDLGSTNGTFVGGHRIEQQPLSHGDIVGIGPDAVLHFTSGAAPAPDADRLRFMSARETEVAQLVAMGRKNSEIAAELSISPRTVERHVANALRRLGLRSRVDLARYILKGQ